MEYKGCPLFLIGDQIDLHVLQGVTVERYKAGATSASSPSGSSGPPPPPAPPPPPPPTGGEPTPAPAGGAAAVFAELNRGEDVTKGLRKVDKSEMTHKNPDLRASSVVPGSAGAGAPGKCALRIC